MSFPDTTGRAEVRITRPLTDADREWVKELTARVARSCQCKEVTHRHPRHGDVPWTWLEHCPLHTLSGPRARPWGQP